jgi:VWFA-related protein
MPVLNDISRRSLLAGVTAALAGRLLHGQRRSPADGPAFSAEVQVVNVLATVRDKKGRIVKDLVKDDFTVMEDGKPQEIRYFTRETGLPLTVGLIVDMTPSESNMLAVERRTSLAFLNQMLRPEKDQAFLIQFNDEVELLQDLTSSREKLEAALSELEQSPQEDGRGAGGRTTGRGGPPGGSGAAGRGGYRSTALSDAVFLASDEVLKPVAGRKALIVLGDGDHIGSRKEMAITAAQQNDTAVYAIRIYDSQRDGGRQGGPGGLRIPGIGGGGIGMPGGRGGGGGRMPAPNDPGGRGRGGGIDPKGLKEIALRTGGSYFETGKKQTLSDIYTTIEEELRNQYSLGYTPLNSEPGYRRLSVGVRKKGLTAQAREGYYARSKR